MKYARLVTLTLVLLGAGLLGGCEALYLITGTPRTHCELAWDTLRLDTLQSKPVIRDARCVGEK